MSKVKKETPKHAEAFEYYFSLGDDNRSFDKVSKKLNVTRAAVQSWAQSFNWQQRVELRNLEINKKIDEKSKDEHIKQKAKMINDVDALLVILRKSLAKTLKDIKQEAIEFDQHTTAKQFDDFSKAIDRVMTLRMKLTGEITEKTLTIKLPDDFEI